MRRVNGFLCLEDELELSDNTDFFYINNKEYYFKPTSLAYNELVCSEIANLLNVNCVQYDLAILNRKEGVISESYRKENATYIQGCDILEKFWVDNKEFVNEMGLRNFDWKKNWVGPNYIHMNNLEIIWPCFYSLYKKYPEEQIQKCINDLILQFIFMILTCQHDRGAHQWELEETPETISIVPMYDNEASFPDSEIWTGMSTGFGDCEQSPSVVLKEFLTISSSEYVNLFLEKFNLLTEDAFIKAIHLVENKISAAIPLNDKDKLITNFRRNRSNIEKILEELNLMDKMGR